MSISVVVAKVVRENEQYNYRVVGKGEKYLVQHDEVDNAGDIVREYLTPYAKEPVVIESIVLQKSCDLVWLDEEDSEWIYKGVIVLKTESEEGKLLTKRKTLYIGAKNMSNALESLEQEAREYGYVSHEVLSLTKTNIIELIKQ